MAIGKISSLHPPKNNGAREGEGTIIISDEDRKKLLDLGVDVVGIDLNLSLTGSNQVVFKTPDSVNQSTVPVNEGDAVSFDIVNGKVSNIQHLVITCALTADNTSIQSGSSVTLSWTSQYADLLTIDNGIGNVTPTDKGFIKTSSINTTTTFTLTATNKFGQSASASVLINVFAGKKD